MSFLSELVEDRRRLNRVGGMFAVAIGLLLLLTALSYHGTDRPFFFSSDIVTAGQDSERVTLNLFGRVGATFGEGLMQTLGAGAFLFCGLLIAFGWQRFRQWDSPFWGRLFTYLGIVVSVGVLLDLGFGHIVFRESLPFPAGGVLGVLTTGWLISLVNRPGAWLFAVVGLVLAVALASRPSFTRAAAIASEAARRSATALREKLAEFRERRRSLPAATRVNRPAAPAPAVRADKKSDDREAPGSTAPVHPKISLRKSAAGADAAARGRRTIVPKKPEPRQQALPMAPGSRDYSLPAIDLLNEPEPQEIENEHELLRRARHITDKLREFSVGGSIVAVHPGPVVTTFEFKPDAGVKYSKVAGMTDDLSLALKAESVRIDRMAGRSTIGIEVPNRKQETIFPKELIGSERFRNSRSKLTLALGKDIHGEVFTAELERMPHLLIAGATGAGKSVGLNGMIVSLLYKATPDDLRFIMIDTKMIELGVYSGIPHLLIPVVTDPKKAAAALKWAVREMEQRYRKLSSVGVRNLAQFNDLMQKEPGRTMHDSKTGDEVPLTKLPSIVIVIDELADLMMVASSEVEEAIMRLAQMARAVGIHLVLATQRPSVDVITGTIKANFPSRIAYRVSQRVDSRTIIDQQGAEHLLGRGDMLFLSTGAARLTRLHSGFITESELHRITSWLKKMSEPNYDESVLADAKETPGGTPASERDEMYNDAVRTVIQEGKCSITLIQRRLQLGYARAARIVDFMEQEGIVSAGEGSKPREILVGPEFLEGGDPGGPRAGV